MSLPFPTRRTHAPDTTDPQAGARAVAALAAGRAAALDRDGAFPDREIAALAAAGLLTAPMPAAHGGLGLGTEPAGAEALLAVLRRLGAASLPLGRLYEGHVNALRLVVRCGSPDQATRAARDVADGHLFGVWNTEIPPGLRLARGDGGWRLEGAKAHASGAGHVTRALVTARSDADAPVMVLARLDPAEAPRRADLGPWAGVHGMRASATGRYDLGGIAVTPADRIGAPGDYERQPDFSAGAWRFCAVQLGGAERLVDLLCASLRESGRTGHPAQRARVAASVAAVETARLWLARAAALAEGAAGAEPDAAVAYVGLCRLTVERACLDVLEAVHRSVGMRAFAGGEEIERITRDLQLYLRQPAPDLAADAAAAHVLAADRPVEALWPEPG